MVALAGRHLPTSLTDRCFFGSSATLPRLVARTRYECVTPSAASARVVQVIGPAAPTHPTSHENQCSPH